MFIKDTWMCKDELKLNTNKTIFCVQRFNWVDSCNVLVTTCVLTDTEFHRNNIDVKFDFVTVLWRTDLDRDSELPQHRRLLRCLSQVQGESKVLSTHLICEDWLTRHNLFNRKPAYIKAKSMSLTFYYSIWNLRDKRTDRWTDGRWDLKKPLRRYEKSMC